MEPLKYYLDKMNIKIVTIEYKENVEVVVEVLKQMSNNFEKQNAAETAFLFSVRFAGDRLQLQFPFPETQRVNTEDHKCADGIACRTDQKCGGGNGVQ